MQIQRNVPLAEYTSWLIGGPAEYFCLPTEESEVYEAWQFALDNQLPVTVFGGGSNVLVSDQGIRGLTICLRRFSKCSTEERDGFLWIHCLAGTGKSDLLKVFLKAKLEPALFLAGLPGDVGGGIIMNAGVSENLKPREFGEIVDSFTVLTHDGSQFKEIHYRHHDVTWSYRHSSGWEKGIVLRATLKWPLHPDPQILEKVKQANRVRLSKQPLDMPSCGSVFINPQGHKSAQLIDSCGLKGLRKGDAQVSLKHANFIVNLDRATAKDTWDLILEVQKTVLEKTGVQLKTEVVRLGDWPADS
ncbi:MAG: UDP-N-acetylmuramate dehydrogenase [Bdellovibrionales bacterium]